MRGSLHQITHQFIDLHLRVGIRPAQIVSPSGSFRQFKRVQNTLCQIMDQKRLFQSHTIIGHKYFIKPKLLKHSPSLHIIIITTINNSRSENSSIWENIQNLLFRNILSRQIQRFSILLSTRTRHMNQSDHFVITFASLGDSFGDFDVDILHFVSVFHTQSRTD